MATGSEFQFVYMTAPNKDSALEIGRRLVEQRLAACVNVIEHMTSLYFWQGAVQRDDEVVLIAKTRDDLMASLVTEVKALHPYECPCIVALPIGMGSAEYLDWVRTETQLRPTPKSPGPGS